MQSCSIFQISYMYSYSFELPKTKNETKIGVGTQIERRDIIDKEYC